jgi:hypothetical protein
MRIETSSQQETYFDSPLEGHMTMRFSVFQAISGENYMPILKLGFLFFGVTLLASVLGGCAPVPCCHEVVILVPDPGPCPHPSPDYPSPPDIDYDPYPTTESTYDSANVATKTRERPESKIRGRQRAERSPARITQTTTNKTTTNKTTTTKTTNTRTPTTKKRGPASGKTKTR